MYIHNERGCPTDGDKTHSTISKNSVDFAHQALTLSLGLILFKRDPDQRVCDFLPSGTIVTSQNLRVKVHLRFGNAALKLIS